MANMKAVYLGDLRVECTHVASGTTLVTDAPVDNNGKGEAFSPTDLCATALAACCMTIIGIYGRTHDVDVTGTSIDIVKTMSADPRRIGKSKSSLTCRIGNTAPGRRPRLSVAPIPVPSI